jgi:hypothetical protein
VLLTAVGLAFLLLAVPVWLACIAALKGDAAKDKREVRAAPPVLEPGNVAPVAAPTRPVASFVPKEVVSFRPVYVQKS